MTVYGNSDACVLAVPSMDLRVQAAVSQAVETVGFSVMGTGLCIGRGLEVCKRLEQRRVFSEHHVGC